MPKGQLHILADVGTGDKFLKDGQLEPETLKDAAKDAGREIGEVEVRMQDGYDHSYFFVSLALEINARQEGSVEKGKLWALVVGGSSKFRRMTVGSRDREYHGLDQEPGCLSEK